MKERYSFGLLALLSLGALSCRQVDCSYDFLKVYDAELYACQEVPERFGVSKWFYRQADQYEGGTFCGFEEEKDYCCFSLEQNLVCENPLEMSGYGFSSLEDTNH